MVGCRVGAKNTLVKNYLCLAERPGPTVAARCARWSTCGPLPRQPERVRRRRRAHRRLAAPATSAQSRHRPARWCSPPATWGTQNLLHAMKAVGALPRLSARLGELHPHQLRGAARRDDPECAAGGADLTRGVAITSSFQPDEDTHVENGPLRQGLQRHGAAGDPADRRRRSGAALGRAGSRRRPPSGAARVPHAVAYGRWSERHVIGLVMQSLDNSITVRPGAGLLGRSG